MEKLKTIAMVFVAIISIVLPACSKDEPDDGNKNEIVGVWTAQRDDNQYSLITLDVKKNGMLTCSVTAPNSANFSGWWTNGTWTYKNGIWTIDGTREVDGQYHIVDNKLMSPGKIFTRSTGSSGSSTEQEDPELVKLYGSWKGSIDSDSFVLTFTSEGKMSEKVNGKDMNSVGFTFKNGELTFSSGTVLENCMGTAPIVVQFASSAKSMTIWKKSNPSDKYTFTKQ